MDHDEVEVCHRAAHKWIDIKVSLETAREFLCEGRYPASVWPLVYDEIPLLVVNVDWTRSVLAGALAQVVREHRPA
jgi:hypothetical protein